MSNEEARTQPAKHRFVIDRRKWLRGEKESVRLLRPSDGRMCCLGIFALSCGLSQEQISDLGEPHEIMSEPSPPVALPEPMKFLLAREEDPCVTDESTGEPMRVWMTTGPGYDFMSVNDATDIDDAQREKKLAAMFAHFGVEVEFDG